MAEIKFFGKKGMTAALLVSMMITLVAFVMISGTLMRFMSEADDVAAENLCYDSISLRAMTAYQLEIAGQKIEGKLVPPLCKTIDKEVSGSKEEVIKEVADSMARCWWMFGAGEYEEILHGVDIDVIYNLESTETKCFNCYTLLMDDDDFEGEEYILASEIEDYMLNNHYKNSGKTYVDYIQSYGGPGRMIVGTTAILPNYGYTVSMMPKLKDSDASAGIGIAEIGAGLAIIAVGVGGTICVVGTGGACLAAILGAAAGTTVSASSVAAVTGTAAVTYAVIGTGTAVAATGAYTMVDGRNEIYASLVDEDARTVSSVYLLPLDIGEEKCPGGDLAGQ